MPSLRRSSRRDDQAASAAEPLVASTLTLSHPPKRHRISSISENGNLKKRRKIEHYEYPTKLKFPLRSRPNNEPLRSLPLKNGTKPVSLDQKEDSPTPCTTRQKHINQNAAEKLRRQQSPSLSNDKRTLRSQDGGSRSKSELSLYFNNYEQMLTLQPAKSGWYSAFGNLT